MNKKISIVVTTIFEPNFISSYLDNFEHYGHVDHVDLIVIPDRKTPRSVYEKSALFRDKGFSVICPSLEEQEQFVRKFPSMTGRIPYDSDNRRNIGFLMALDRAAEVMISIDDDNYCIAGSDFVTEHAVVGDICLAPVIESTDHWFNPCTMLESQVSEAIYPRGFPYFARHTARSINSDGACRCRVAMNVGLWLNDPDVDAVSRLALAPKISGANGVSVLLGTDTWSPINTQNTALTREAVAAYYYVRMGYSIGGMTIDRYGDILSGYLCQKCVKTIGEHIRVGNPVTEHQRTPHNPFKDLYHELAGMVLIEDLLPWLMEVKISANTYLEAYDSLASALENQIPKFAGFVWDEGGREFLRETVGHMRAWTVAVQQIG